MVREGIPHSLRPYIWMRLAGAMTKRANSEVSYRQIVRYVSCVFITLYHVNCIIRPTTVIFIMVVLHILH